MRFIPIIFTLALGFILASPAPALSEIVSTTDKVVAKFMELDTDESLTVSYEEYEQMVLQRMFDRFTAMDTNEDNEVSEEEYRAFWTSQKAQYYRPAR